jgi:hypothetical protein
VEPETFEVFERTAMDFSQFPVIIGSMTKPADKFEATRTVVETIKEFDPKEQEMIFRWAAETLGLPQPFSVATRGPVNTASTIAATPPQPSIVPAAASGSAQDIQSFVASKRPRSDVQFAATVAYYYRFVAPEPEKKASITEKDLLDACRKVTRQRPKHPYMTLNNAFHAGLLDRPDKGSFSINAVGENLVAMTLPGENPAVNAKKKTVKTRKPRTARKAGKKASAKNKA